MTAVAILVLTIPKNVFIYSGIIHFNYIFITSLHACIILYLVTN